MSQNEEKRKRKRKEYKVIHERPRHERKGVRPTKWDILAETVWDPQQLNMALRDGHQSVLNGNMNN